LTGHLDIFNDYTPPIPNIHFNGETYYVGFALQTPEQAKRRVHDLMIDGHWRTLREVEYATGDPQASISARFRDFNNHAYLKQFFVMEHRRRGDHEDMESGSIAVTAETHLPE
jgi:hypothetical protein